MINIQTLLKRYPKFPSDVPLDLPHQSSLSPEDLHFLIYIPWRDDYINFVPVKYQDFYLEMLPYLSARTTDVYTAVCLQYLKEFIEKSRVLGEKVQQDVIAYALILHDSGWSQMSEEEVAMSLGVTGLALNEKAMGPKEKHAVLGEKIARQVYTEKQVQLGLNDEEIKLICRAILYHDKPEEVAGAEYEMPLEVQLLVDLDHIWSFTHFNFWQDTLRKGVPPSDYIENLKRDLNSYFVTTIGKEKAKEMLAEREREVALIGL